jgi:23S rRNA 5-hydroxycytidine C2501 synthase
MSGNLPPSPVELLAPAKTAGIGRQAILHGAELEPARRLVHELYDAGVARPWFVPASAANKLRREALDKLEAARRAAAEPPVSYPEDTLSYLANVYKQAKGVTGVQGQVRAEPMLLVNGNEKLTLKFDCRACEMHVMGRMKKHILKSPPPSVVPVTFHPRRA